MSRFSHSLARLIEDMLDTVREPGRAGLAANQIGSTLAVFAYNVDEDFGYLINPEVTCSTRPTTCAVSCSSTSWRPTSAVG